MIETRVWIVCCNLHIVSRTLPEFFEFSICGIYDSLPKAIKACHSENMFYSEFILNQDWIGEGVEGFPKIVYPKLLEGPK